MKRLFFLVLLFVAPTLFATDYTPLMQNSDPYLIAADEVVPVDGSPMIYIEGKTPKKSEEEPTSALDNSMTLSTPVQQELNFTFQTPFQRTVQAGLIEHISDLDLIIQPLDTGTISISEEIIQLNVKPDAQFQRTITLPDKAEFDLLTFTQNGVPVTPERTTTETNDIVLLSPTGMDIGPNKIHIRYLIKYPLSINATHAILNVHLTGRAFPLPINRLQAVVLFPHKTNILDNQLFFGANKQLVPEAFESIQDSHGNITYHFTHLVPANTDIQTQLIFDKSAVAEEELWENILGSKATFLFFLILGLAAYFIASVYLEIKQPLPSYLPTVLKRVSPIQLIALFNISDTSTYFNNILIYNKNNKKIKILARLCKYRIGRVLCATYSHISTFLWIMGETCLGTGLLIALAYGIIFLSHASLPLAALIITLLLSFVVILYLYRCFFKPDRIKFVSTYVQMAMEVKTLASLSNIQIQALSPLMMATNQYIKWLAMLKKYNPHYIIQNTGGKLQ